MCGRFTLTSDSTSFIEMLPGFNLPESLSARYNIAPTQDVTVAANSGHSKLELFHWGLIPSWAKDPRIGNRMINARSETLGDRPSFRHAYRHRRCFVLADGYYEWRTEPGGGPKTPYYIRMASEKPFLFAGLWETWQPPEEEKPVLSCTIITCPANELLERIHHRMPVILDPETYDLWLDTDERGSRNLDHLLQPYPAEEMMIHAVSRLVNHPKNNSADCIQPV